MDQELINEYVEARKRVREMLNLCVGSEINYRQSGHNNLPGVILEVHEAVSKIFVKNIKSGKSYWIFWSRIGATS